MLGTLAGPGMHVCRSRAEAEELNAWNSGGGYLNPLNRAQRHLQEAGAEVLE